LKGFVSSTVTAQNTLLRVFCAAKATAKPHIQAQVISAVTLYQRFDKIVIIQIIQVATISTFFIKDNKLLFNDLNLVLFINIDSNETFKKFVK